jgi:hypothetical protein
MIATLPTNWESTMPLMSITKIARLTREGSTVKHAISTA